LEPCPTTRPSPASPQPGLHPPLFSTAALDVVRHHLVEAGSVQIQVVWSDRGTACCVSCSSSSAIMLPRRTRHVHAPHSRAGGRRSVAVLLTNSAVSRRSVSPPIEGPWNAQGEAAGPARRNLEESTKHSAVRPAPESAPLWWSGARCDTHPHHAYPPSHGYQMYGGGCRAKRMCSKLKKLM